MKNHLDNLIKLVPDLLSKKILDLGSGKGQFLIELKRRGAEAVGVEPTQEYIDISLQSSEEAGLPITVIEGVAEKIPLPETSVGFVNIGEVIEHVENPKTLLKEVYRVLEPGGKAYLSVPNRFGMRDQHFHLYFINWMPRSWAHTIIGMLGKHKDYSGVNGRQSLLEMHYYTYPSVIKLCREQGFLADDIRVKKIKNKFGGLSRILVLSVYLVLRNFYWDSFHILLSKENE